jgi:CDP-paratose 2-epimerase
VPIESNPATSPVDIPVFITDTRRIRQSVGWKPRRAVETILGDTLEWIRNNEARLENLFF